jgi:hypothetical protein
MPNFETAVLGLNTQCFIITVHSKFVYSVDVLKPTLHIAHIVTKWQ